MKEMESYNLIMTVNGERYVAHLHYYPAKELRTKPCYVCYFNELEVGAEGHTLEEVMENFFKRWEDYNEFGP
jgi:hypothetical protein